MIIVRKILFVCCVLVCIIYGSLIYKSHVNPPKLSFDMHGYFPLYDSKCISFICVNKHPYVLDFSIDIESVCPNTNLMEEVKLKVDGFQNGNIVYSTIVCGTSFQTYSATNQSVCVRTINIIELYCNKFMKNSDCDAKNGFAVNVPFDLNEACVYRISVLTPCAKYECLTTTLVSKSHY